MTRNPRFPARRAALGARRAARRRSVRLLAAVLGALAAAGATVPPAQAQAAQPGQILSNVRTQPSERGGEWQFWWSAQSALCLRVAIGNGQVTQIITVSPAQCGQRDGGSAPIGGDRDPSDLVHRDIGFASRELDNRGFTLAGSESARGGGFWQYWWNARLAQCQRVAVSDNQVTQVIRTDPGACGPGASGATPPLVDREPTDLVHRDVGFASRELANRGYTLAHSESARAGGFWQFWWNARLAQCQRVAVSDNQVTQVIRAANSDCGH